jgi:hypothetical protein
MSASEPSSRHRKALLTLSKPRAPLSCGKSLEVICELTKRQPVYRRHELNSGFGGERENLACDVKRKSARGQTASLHWVARAV